MSQYFTFRLKMKKLGRIAAGAEMTGKGCEMSLGSGYGGLPFNFHPETTRQEPVQDVMPIERLNPIDSDIPNDR